LATVQKLFFFLKSFISICRHCQKQQLDSNTQT
jgi:hypothetical protein